MVDPPPHVYLPTHHRIAPQNGQGGASSSAANVIPTEKLAHGMAVAKSFLGSLGSRARKSLEDLNETPAMQKVRREGDEGGGRLGVLEWLLYVGTRTISHQHMPPAPATGQGGDEAADDGRG